VLVGVGGCGSRMGGYGIFESVSRARLVPLCLA